MRSGSDGEGLEEVLDEEYLRYRIGQVRALGVCWKGGVPIVESQPGPCGLCECERVPAASATIPVPGTSPLPSLYRDYGIRTVEIGTVMFGKRDAATEETIYPALELVRLAIPDESIPAGICPSWRKRWWISTIAGTPSEGWS